MPGLWNKYVLKSGGKEESKKGTAFFMYGIKIFSKLGWVFFFRSRLLKATVAVVILFYYFFGHTYSIQKFPDQGPDWSHSSDNNAKSLTVSPRGNCEFCYFHKTFNSVLTHCV